MNRRKFFGLSIGAALAAVFRPLLPKSLDFSREAFQPQSEMARLSDRFYTQAALSQLREAMKFGEYRTKMYWD